MSHLLDSVIDYFNEESWDFTRQENQSVLQMRYQGENASLRCFAQVKEEADQFLFFSLASVQVSPPRMRDVAELLTRLNYGLPIGNFEMDFEDGEVRYRTSIDVENSQLDSALIGNLVHANVQVMDNFLPAIIAVNDGTKTPESALDMGD